MSSSDPARAEPALRVAGFTPFSTLDWPGRLAAVVWLQGCPWRCAYCHNPHLQPRTLAPGAPTWPWVLEQLARRVGLIDAVVFSGGEPTLDPALPGAIDAVRALGFAVGLHSAGMAPRRLQALLPKLDWIGLDVKAPLAAAHAALHDSITGRRGSQAAVRQSLVLVQAQAQRRAGGLAYECRSTIHPTLHDTATLQALAGEMSGVQHWALQVCRPQGAAQPLPAVPPGFPRPALQAQLREQVPALELRAG